MLQSSTSSQHVLKKGVARVQRLGGNPSRRSKGPLYRLLPHRRHLRDCRRSRALLGDGGGEAISSWSRSRRPLPFPDLFWREASPSYCCFSPTRRRGNAALACGSSSLAPWTPRPDGASFLCCCSWLSFRGVLGWRASLGLAETVPASGMPVSLTTSSSGLRWRLQRDHSLWSRWSSWQTFGS